LKIGIYSIKVALSSWRVSSHHLRYNIIIKRWCSFNLLIGIISFFNFLLVTRNCVFDFVSKIYKKTVKLAQQWETLYLEERANNGEKRIVLEKQIHSIVKPIVVKLTFLFLQVSFFFGK